jgi:hypothetical protein
VSGKIIKCSLFLTQYKVYQPVWSQRQKAAKKHPNDGTEIVEGGKI